MEFTHTNMGGTTLDHEYEWSPCVGLGDKGAKNAGMCNRHFRYLETRCPNEEVRIHTNGST